jgi:hypothetical protein
LDPTDHRDQTRNDGISQPWRKSCWLAQDAEGSTADLMMEAGRMFQELAGESRRNWETRARNQAMRVMHVASEAYEALGSRQWTMQDCHEYEEELE